MAEVLLDAHLQPNIRERVGEWWQHNRRRAAAVGVAVLSVAGLTGCDPDGPGSLPDIPIDMTAAPFRAASTSEPDPDVQRWREAEQRNNIDKFINYRRMLDAMHRFAANKRGAVLDDPGWFFEKYELAERLTKVPKEILMAVNGIESSWVHYICQGDAYDGNMQIGVNEFDKYSKTVDLPDDRGAPNRCSPDWSIVTAGAYLRALGLVDGDPYMTEMALRRYNSGSTSGGVGYARTAMQVAREGGLGY